MRALVRGLLVADLPSDLGITEDDVYGSSGTTGNPRKPFVEIKFGGRYPGMGAVRRRRLEVWVHDEQGDYDRIEAILKYVKSILSGAEHRSDSDGNEIILCSWQNDSVDLYDDGYSTNCMMSSFEIVGKEPA